MLFIFNVTKVLKCGRIRFDSFFNFLIHVCHYPINLVDSSNERVLQLNFFSNFLLYKNLAKLKTRLSLLEPCFTGIKVNS